MATTTRTRSRPLPPRQKAKPPEQTKYLRNTGKPWSDKDLTQLRDLAKENTPTRVIGLKLGRSETSVRSQAQRQGVSLKPVNQSPRTPARRAAARPGGSSRAGGRRPR